MLNLKFVGGRGDWGLNQSGASQPPPPSLYWPQKLVKISQKYIADPPPLWFSHKSSTAYLLIWHGYIKNTYILQPRGLNRERAQTNNLSSRLLDETHSVGLNYGLIGIILRSGVKLSVHGQWPAFCSCPCMKDNYNITNILGVHRYLIESVRIDAVIARYYASSGII